MGNDLARIIEKCDLGPGFMSDVTRCKLAFVDFRGSKIDVNDDVQKLLDDFMPQVAKLKPWVKVERLNRSPEASLGTRLPYRLHILTVSPVVLLVVPREPNDTEYCAGRGLEEGCIRSRVFDLEPYWYKRQPRVAEGSFWVAPALGVTFKQIDTSAGHAFIDLKDSRLRLASRGGAWCITREAAAH
ncbi:hypothetical protein [Polaromonas glacialis]|uniref:hypothetical protein n=1 Tax=Polaromonas glacialis TaxID=866564 RepID=UPI0004953350|nr:hypothetical protein [Polaromonas glacialis]